MKIKVPVRFVSRSGVKDDRVKILKVRNFKRKACFIQG